jgi:hypothetical protein
MTKFGSFLGIPYDWRRPTRTRFVERVWNRRDRRVFTPKVFGWGWTINLPEVGRRLRGELHAKRRRR